MNAHRRDAGTAEISQKIVLAALIESLCTDGVLRGKFLRMKKPDYLIVLVVPLLALLLSFSALAQNGTAVVEVLGSQYVIQALDALENVNNLDGVKRRLEILGHDVGTINTTMDQPTERGVLNFQADNGIRMDGVITPATRTAIQNAVHTLGGD
jgi:hypothetical protein